MIETRGLDAQDGQAGRGIYVGDGDCSTCKLQGALVVLLTIGQEMKLEGRFDAFMAALADLTTVVLTGDSGEIEPFLEGLEQLLHKTHA